MDRWKDAVVKPDTLLGETIRRIETSATQIALVVDAQGRLIGTVTDGDIRRSLIKGLGVSSQTRDSMNPDPLTLKLGTSAEDALNFMRTHSIHHVPLVDEAGCLTGAYFIDELVGVVQRPNAVVLMAGGPGTRLRPLTDVCPKPLLPIGGKPILERILDRFIEQGFRRFYISVNYMAEMIMAHFGNGERWGVRIDYLREIERLGTAGALSLIPETLDQALLVMNGDLLTEADFVALLKAHEVQDVMATMAVREYEMQIPYGVVNAVSGLIKSVQEKPVQKFLVNAGIYVLQPDVLKHIPKGYVDMPTLFESLSQNGPTYAYQLSEYWVDIGRLEDLEAAQFSLQSGA